MLLRHNWGNAMTPIAHTFYSLALFFALVSLSLWAKRRRRVSDIVKRAVSGLTRSDEA